MIPATTFSGRKVALFGLGRSGAPTVQALAAGGAEVVAWDDNERARAQAQSEGLSVSDLSAADWSGFDTLVLAPGVPLTHPEPHWTVQKAHAARVEVIGDIEIFARERLHSAPDAPFIAITGTNGKSTTTALIAHILRECGRDIQMGGNIGVPILSLEPPAENRIHVVEMSSYQIDLTPTLHPTVGILLNVSPDHLDRHGTFENYAAIKARLPAESQAAVICVDDAATGAISQELIQKGHPRVVQTSTRNRIIDGFYLEAGRIYRARDGGREAVADLDGLQTLRGVHNAQNVMAAFAALEQHGLEFREVSQALASFPGLAHRMELVGHVGRVAFVNDSKATNAESAAVALASFERDIFWICGGRAKEGGLESLAHYFPRIAKAYLIGECEEAFANSLEGRLAYARCGTLERAVELAAADAAEATGAEPVVLLAPACASFDQFPSFEHRGDQFRACVAALPGADVRTRAD